MIIIIGKARRDGTRNSYSKYGKVIHSGDVSRECCREFYGYSVKKKDIVLYLGK